MHSTVTITLNKYRSLPYPGSIIWYFCVKTYSCNLYEPFLCMLFTCCVTLITIPPTTLPALKWKFNRIYVQNSSTFPALASSVLPYADPPWPWACSWPWAWPSYLARTGTKSIIIADSSTPLCFLHWKVISPPMLTASWLISELITWFSVSKAQI